MSLINMKVMRIHICPWELGAIVFIDCSRQVAVSSAGRAAGFQIFKEPIFAARCARGTEGHKSLPHYDVYPGGRGRYFYISDEAFVVRVMREFLLGSVGH
jgi:hypothetical protein